MNNTRSTVAAGLLLALAGSLILMGIITGEALYPDAYGTHANTISDLGGTRPPESIVRQPSAAIFDTTMIVTGLLVATAAYLIQRELRRPVLAVPTGLLGVGILGVGLFPGHTEPHPLFALLTFVAGGVAAVLSYRVVTTPLRYLCLGFGVVALTALAAGLFLLDWGPVAELGEGGIERWVAYPQVLWLVAIGSHLVSSGAGSVRPGQPGRSARETIPV